ncbi:MULTISPECIES: glutaredoxin 2 [unclassified Vibrio]|uniref:Glutaredoxin 2 n=1 Tax=Vibrio sp. HB236076 TaxID=3232307 RepID=A0AB39HI90_9VIBR|nr:glutaredoxin 2 [Vibrio sp. HB161653]MDP5254720.1 glutaredoxin 2 [Vibrio sp. HB161653]
MKLFIYQHCPFCARVAYVANTLNLELEYQVVDYADAQTLMDLTGQKQVPVLQKEDGSVMAESLDIMAYFFAKGGQEVKNTARNETLDFQRESLPLLQKIGYPRWPALGLREFATSHSIDTWQKKKQTADLNFAQLLANTAMIVDEVNGQLLKAEQHLQLSHEESELPLIDQAIYFSLLRGWAVEPSMVWPKALRAWLENKSIELNIGLLA